MPAADWGQVRLVLVRAPGNPHPSAFSEAMEFLQHSLRELGCDVDTRENEFLPEGTNILFGSHVLPPEILPQLPARCVVFNAEQLGSGSAFDSEGYREILRRYPVWDYSARNVEKLRDFLPPERVRHVPIGYVPQLTRIEPAAVQDIDVLFYGSINERRKKILEELRRAGLVMQYAYGIYGAERDQLIARAKVVVNIHFFPTKIFEIFRVSYLLANRKAVVSECSDDTEIDARLLEAVQPAAYEGLVEACQRLVHDHAARARLEQDGFVRWSRLTFREELAQAVQSTRF